MGWTPDPRRIPVGPTLPPYGWIGVGQLVAMRFRAAERHGATVEELYAGAHYWQARELRLRNEPWWQHAGRRRRRQWRTQHREAARYAKLAAERCLELLGEDERRRDPVLAGRRDPGAEETY